MRRSLRFTAWRCCRGSRCRHGDRRRDRATKTGEWRFYSADNRATKYSPVDQINKDNVASLRVAWRRPQVDPAIARRQSAASPLEPIHRRRRSWSDGVLYAPNGARPRRGDRSGDRQDARGRRSRSRPARTACSAAARTGRRVLGPGRRRAHPHHPRNSISSRSIRRPASRSRFRRRRQGRSQRRPRSAHARLPLERRAARRRATSSSSASSMLEQDSAPNKEGPPGDVRAYDVRTGKLRWTFHVDSATPASPASKPGRTTRGSYTGAGNVWSMMSADDELGYVYLPTTGATNDMYGGHRLGNNLFTSSHRVPRRRDRQARLALPDRAPRSVRLRQSRPRRSSSTSPSTASRSRRSRRSRSRGSCSCSIA